MAKRTEITIETLEIRTIHRSERGSSTEIRSGEPVRPTNFGGSIEIVLGGETHTLQLLGTINSGGRIIGIAHRSGPGHMIVDAELIPASDGVPATLKGQFHFELEHGIEHEGTFEAPLARPTAS